MTNPEAVQEAEHAACSHIRLTNGVEYDIVFDGWSEDPQSRCLAKGEDENDSCIRLMLALVPRDGVVLDLGTFMGSFALAAAANGCDVVAVDASPSNVAYLRASAARNRFDRLRVVHAAITDRPQVLEFKPQGLLGHVVTSQSLQLDNPDTEDTIRVRGVAVSDLLAELGLANLDFIKMDIEGSEIVALQGMEALLARPNAPPILYESNYSTLAFYGQTPAQLMARLEQLGYANYLIWGDQLIPFGSDEWQPAFCMDFLAVKHFPPGFQGWQVVAPMSLRERIGITLNQCQDPDFDCRKNIGYALAKAPPAVLTPPEIRTCLAAMKEDPTEDVRAAVRWWSPDCS